MAENSKIEWTDHTFNPWIGCQAVSPDGCKNCYAEALVNRFGDDFTQRRRTSDANWKLPLKWDRQAEREGRRFRVFCASLADVFDNAVPVEWRRDLFTLILNTPHLDWLLLTKRIGNAAGMIDEVLPDNMKALPHDCPAAWPWPNVWIGATVVNQAEADRDIPKLLRTPAAVRFLSIEPMVGPINLRHINVDRETDELDVLKAWTWEQELEAWRGTADGWEDDFEDWYGTAAAGATGPMHAVVDWVIVGGESGRGADIRPMHPQWARDLRDQCADAGTPFLFKQHGEWREPLEGERFDTSMGGAAKPPAFIVSKDDGTVHCFHSSYIVDGRAVIRVGKKVAGRLLDGVEHNGFPSHA